jgi:uncharacterized protein (TIGR02594 family)
VHGGQFLGSAVQVDDTCPWMKIALGELGQHELAGKRRNNPRIMGYLRSVGLSSWDETPWCSAFTNWCLGRAGIIGSGRANARSWLGWGTLLGITRPRFGCVTVLRRTANPARGHVGFWVGSHGGQVVLLGGNQSDSVCVKAYPLSHVLGHRWPHPALETAPWA